MQPVIAQGAANVVQGLTDAGNVEIVDVTNARVMALAPTLERPLSMGGVCEDVTVVGDTAYVAWLQGGVSSYDLSDLAAIAANNAVATDWGDLQYPALLMQHKGAIGNARGVAVDASGATMVVTDDYGTGKLRVFDVGGVTTATPVGTFDAGNERGAKLVEKMVTRHMAHVINSDALSVL